MAAQLIKGRTLHSFCGIHPNLGVVASRKANARVRSCNMLIIDEISMASSVLLEQVFERFDYAGHEPKLLVVGDFLQLPPVSGEYAFKSKLWPNFTKLHLTTNHRQSDSSFLGALNDLRMGKVTDAVRALVSDRRVASLPTDCTQLFAYRNQAEETNAKRLESIDSKAFCSRWDVRWSGVPLKDKSPEGIAQGRARFPEQLILKVGARVVMLTNNVPEDGFSEPIWVNGSTGEVMGVVGDSVRVLLDNGREVTVRNEEEEVIDGDGHGQVVVSQFPMSLAWALTIHKAQGMTLDKVGIDLHGHFERGQTYVALSRCRSKDGLYLTNDLADVRIDQDALATCEAPETKEQGELESALGRWDTTRKRVATTSVVDWKVGACAKCDSTIKTVVHGPFSGVKYKAKEICASCGSFLRWCKGRAKKH